MADIRAFSEDCFLSAECARVFAQYATRCALDKLELNIQPRVLRTAMHDYCTWRICSMHDLLQNLPESITKEQLVVLFSQYPNLHEVRLVPSKKDIAFVEYLDEESSGVVKDALHNYKFDGENKIKITLTRK